MRIEKIRPGDYYVVYKQEFPPDYLYHKLNLTLQGQKDLVKFAVATRLDSRHFKPSFYSYLIDHQSKRDKLLHYYTQPTDL